jgi:hypothetical protein
MRIYSKFHDYYDPALRDFEAEPTPAYKRETSLVSVSFRLMVDHVVHTRRYLPSEERLIRVENNDYLGAVTCRSESRHSGPTVEMTLRVLGFCGNLYPFYTTRLDYHEASGTWHSPTGIYDSEWSRSVYRAKDPEAFIPGPSRKLWWRGDRDVISVDGYDGLENCRELKGLFLQHRVPAFLWDPRGQFSRHGDKAPRIILNPVLKDIGFHKVLTPWEAMQELQMFLCNDLAEDRTPPMPVGSDVVIAESKGFDKWSFRKMPTKKRKP